MENQTGWPDQLFDVLKGADVRQVGYVPDAGHARLIARCKADNDIRQGLRALEEQWRKRIGTVHPAPRGAESCPPRPSCSCSWWGSAPRP